MIVRREFFASPPGAAPPADNAIDYEDQWEVLLRAGQVVGSREAPLNLMEFVDFECPACRAYHRGTLQEIRRKFGSQLSLIYIHSPLPSHRFARVSAQAAECAAAQDRFAEFVDLVFEKQDSLGLKPWDSFGKEIGAPDPEGFDRCTTGVTSFPRVDSGLALARQIGVLGTPTLLLNGWRFPRPPTERDFSRVADALLAGRKPTL